ncbi:alpha-ketoglutarate-dependent dioxygenase alkB homolog 3 [Kryptolebias marmoratus]|uniref:Alpha-ketoglutarate-dependent dioxygenase alkB homolog 3 n=1 Tax=Kryptolebias marmoratus TaxID=37003 RepID=A0A3Q2ZXP6_KRYMA|nr:alpha-ketoglutarate-dependent dioxygenase alkB homolog 3 [Kryptolebias marmoratus]XP_017288330.1 alpha-ketoglutarate-dependent dioxygenase alkB homolog 3 [Kryptolebias marmoratus]
MSDKRQRARVQGSWAKQPPKQSGQTGGVLNNQPKNVNTASGSWGFGNQKASTNFEFHQPTKPVRDVPPERVIEQAGDYEISHEPSGISRLRLRPGFLHSEEADWMFSKLLAELPWSQKTNYRQGEAYEEPRLTCWYGELSYTYARSTMSANTQWHPLLVTLRKAVEQASGCSFNSLLCNLYRNGHDSIGWHSDDEASLGPKPTIASLSLGDTRVFSLRKQPPPEDCGDYTYVERIRVPLSHGTLLLMEGATQDDWQHQVAKEYHDRGPRINLTFRTIHPEPEGHRPGTKMRFTAKQS